MKLPAVIRDRGQLTIPDKIRDEVEWLHSQPTPVYIRLGTNDSVIIEPIRQEQEKDVDWEVVEKKIMKMRTISAKNGNTINTTEFIRKDRDTRT